MFGGGWRIAPRRNSARYAGGYVPSAFLWGRQKPETNGTVVPLTARILVIVATLAAGLVVAPPAMADAVVVHPGTAASAAGLAKAQPRSNIVAVPKSVLPVHAGVSSAKGSRPFASMISMMMVAADPVVTDPSDWTVSLTMTVDTKVHLTATANKPLSGTGMSIEIHSLTAPAANSQIWRCYTGSNVCPYTTTPAETQSTYIAVVTPTNTSEVLPTTIMAVSGTVTPPAWTVSLAADISTTITLTATVNYELSSPYRYVQIYDLSSGRIASGNINSCSSGTTCVRSGIAPKNADSRYMATLSLAPGNTVPTSDVLATTETITPPPWTITLNGSGTSLTATTNYNITGTGRVTEIFDLSSFKVIKYVGYCFDGTVCTKTPAYPDHQFVATIGGIANVFPPDPILALSNQMGLQGPTAPYETAGGSNPAEMGQCQACTGDPINTSTGEFFETTTDLAVPGRGAGLVQTRTYSSQRAAQNGPLGFGWSTPYNMNAVTLPDGSVQVNQENGARVTFTATGTGTYTAPSHVLAGLVHNADGTWTYTRKTKEVFTFDAAGRLTALSDLNGNATTLAYDANGYMAAATDQAGRSITFTFGAGGRISTATDPAARTASYAYDSGGRLVSVTAPGGAVTQYTYDAGNLLTSKTDPRGYSTVNTYDQARRVIKQTTAAGDLLLSYGYEGADGQTTITSPGGRVTKETYRAGQLIKRFVGAGTAQGGELDVYV